MSDSKSKQGFFGALPTKPGGRRWRTVEIDVAEARAHGRSWPDIAEFTGLKVKTLQEYPSRDWWDAAYTYFVKEIRAQQDDEQRERVLKERQQWQQDDAKLKNLGIKLAMTALIETLQGKRPRDEVKYRRLLDEGVDIEDAEYQARITCKMPSPSDRVWAAKELLTATGYTDANKELAKLGIEQERKKLDQGGGATGLDIEVGIKGVDK